MIPIKNENTNKLISSLLDEQGIEYMMTYVSDLLNENLNIFNNYYNNSNYQIIGVYLTNMISYNNCISIDYNWKHKVSDTKSFSCTLGLIRLDIRKIELFQHGMDIENKMEFAEHFGKLLNHREYKFKLLNIN